VSKAKTAFALSRFHLDQNFGWQVCAVSLAIPVGP
jgi:hypothetical protein